MAFLIGLGIIMAIIGVNSLYDYNKERKAKNVVQDDGAKAAAGRGLPDMADVLEASDTCAAGDDPKAAGGRGVCEGLVLADVIAGKLQRKENIFGLPLTYCEQDGEGKVTAIDREDNIYVIETALRPEYTDLYEQIRADMTVESKRIQKNTDERKVYGIVCTNRPSTLLTAIVEKNPRIRIYNYDISFKNIL